MFSFAKTLLLLPLLHLTLSLPTSTSKDIVARQVVPQSGRPTGGPAQATAFVYNAPLTCTGPTTIPTTSNSFVTLDMVQDTCYVTPVFQAAAFTANLTVAPKTGTVGCYLQIFFEQGCGPTVTNQYHGFTFTGTSPGAFLGCASAPDRDYQAIELLCD